MKWKKMFQTTSQIICLHMLDTGYTKNMIEMIELHFRPWLPWLCNKIPEAAVIFFRAATSNHRFQRSTALIFSSAAYTGFSVPIQRCQQQGTLDAHDVEPLRFFTGDNDMIHTHHFG